jgi:hypothetical protein
MLLLESFAGSVPALERNLKNKPSYGTRPEFDKKWHFLSIPDEYQ